MLVFNWFSPGIVTSENGWPSSLSIMVDPLADMTTKCPSQNFRSHQSKFFASLQSIQDSQVRSKAQIDQSKSGRF
jgi:hypothetical protein